MIIYKDYFRTVRSSELNMVEQSFSIRINTLSFTVVLVEPRTLFLYSNPPFSA